MQGVPGLIGHRHRPRRQRGAAPYAAGSTRDARRPGDPAYEWARLDAAREAARADVEAARAQIAQQAGEAEAAIFDAHLLLLDDSALLGPAQAAIDAGESAAARRGARPRRRSRRPTAASTTPYLRERAADVEDVGGRVLRAPRRRDGAARRIAEAGVLVAPDLTPGRRGGPRPRARAGPRDRARRRHLARRDPRPRARHPRRRRPRRRRARASRTARALVLDGDAGTLEVAPARRRRCRARARRAARPQSAARRARARAREPATLRDGRRSRSPPTSARAADAAGAVELGADGVGLLRTEFLFLDRDDAPSEDEQRAVYEEIAAALDGRPVIIRTLDAGADKPLPFLAPGARGQPVPRRPRHPPRARSTRTSCAPSCARSPPSPSDTRSQVMFPMVATLDEYAPQALTGRCGRRAPSRSA